MLSKANRARVIPWMSSKLCSNPMRSPPPPPQKKAAFGTIMNAIIILEFCNMQSLIEI